MATAYPNSLTTTDWTGTVAALNDTSDSTYLASPSSPTHTQTFLAQLTPLADPGVDTYHTLRLRAALDVADSADVDLVLALENADDSSVIVRRRYTHVPNSPVNLSLTLTSAEATLIHSYGNLQVRGHVQAYGPVYLTWAAVSSATAYRLAIGTSSLASDSYDTVLGNTLSCPVSLTTGRYYSRVSAFVNSLEQSPTADQAVTV
jgi:hypothetical protein